MNKGQANLQDLFLNQVRKENVPVTIYLMSGVQLKGFIKGFDAFTIILDSPGKPAQVVYKHALASVVPAKAINFRTDQAGGSAARPAEERPQQPPEPATVEVASGSAGSDEGEAE